MKATANSFPAAKSQAELKPLLQTYACIYGTIPDVLCQMYLDLPKEAVHP